jgi:transposase
VKERRLGHREEAEKFYRNLAAQARQVRVGMEASGHARWFERLLAELQFELWMGDATEIQRKRGRKQKTDRQDAQHILSLLLKNDFPPIWVASWENRDLRQLLWHRHHMVQARTRIINCRQWHTTKDCCAGRSCGGNVDASNGKRSSWLHGPADAGTICWSCWID